MASVSSYPFKDVCQLVAQFSAPLSPLSEADIQEMVFAALRVNGEELQKIPRNKWSNSPLKRALLVQPHQRMWILMTRNKSEGDRIIFNKGSLKKICYCVEVCLQNLKRPTLRALSVVKKSLRKNKSSHQALLYQAHLLENIKGTRGVLRAVCSLLTNEQTYLITDLFQNTLKDIDRYKLTWVHRLSLAAGCANAVAAIIEKGLMHRDVEPRNFFVNLPGSDVVIAGFERACDFINDETIRGEWCGDMKWTSPETAKCRIEQFRDAIEAPGRKRDLFSLGLVIHYLMTGSELPYQSFDYSILKAQKFLTECDDQKIQREFEHFDRLVRRIDPENRFVDQYPSVLRIIQNLMKVKPSERMEAKDAAKQFSLLLQEAEYINAPYDEPNLECAAKRHCS